MKKNGGIVVFLILILVSSFGYAEESDETGGGSGFAREKKAAVEKGEFSPGSQAPEGFSLENTKIGDVSIPSGSTVSVSNGDLTSSAVESAETTSGLKIKNSLDTTISRNGNVALSSAESVKIGKVTITNVRNLKYDDAKKLISFDSAIKVSETQRMINLDNLKESTIAIKDELISQLQVSSDFKQIFTSILIDGFVETTQAKDGKVEVDLRNYNNNENGSSISYTLDKSRLIIKNQQQKPVISAQQLEPDKPEVIEILKDEFGFITRAENSIITISTEQTDERFVGNETLFDWNQADGVTFALLESPGNYRYQFKELQQDRNGKFAKANKTFAQSFEISRQSGLEKYKLFIDKSSKRTLVKDFSPDTKSAYISLTDHRIKLNGIVTYSRISFDLQTILRFMGGSWWMEVLPADGSFLPILEILNSDTTSEILLDQNNIHANVSITPKFNGGKAYTIYFDDLSISETSEGLSRSWTTAPFIIDEFKTTTNNNLAFKNTLTNGWTVAQLQDNIPTAFFHSKFDDRKKTLDKQIKNYAEPACDELNQKLNITQKTIDYLRGLFE